MFLCKSLHTYCVFSFLQRQVQTSELMMLDRMFLADEQQSLIRLRQDYENDFLSLTAESAPPPAPNIPTAHQDKDSSVSHQESSNHVCFIITYYYLKQF